MSQLDSPAAVAQDRQDERLVGPDGLRGAARATIERVRSGELGAVPVMLGLIVICVVFQALNGRFLSSDNLSNLLRESVPTGVIALGIVCVLLLGEIDLSVGSVSGVAGAILCVLFVNKGVPGVLAIVCALLVGVGAGLLYSVIFNRLGVPSFVISLAGLLAFLGLQLALLGSQGAINLPFDSPLVEFAQLKFVPQGVAYVIVAIIAGGLFATGYLHARARHKAELSGVSNQLLIARSGAVV